MAAVPQFKGRMVNRDVGAGAMGAGTVESGTALVALARCERALPGEQQNGSTHSRGGGGRG